MNSNNKDRNSVNLGIGEILNPIKGSVAEAETNELLTDPQIYPAKQFSNDWVLGDTVQKFQPEQESDEFEKLWNQSDYSKLIAFAEQLTSKDGLERLIAKIWWVRAHAKLSDLPISFLVASILGQNLSENLNEAPPKYKKLVEDVLLELSNLISSEENAKTSIQLMEQLCALNPNYKTRLISLVNKELNKDRTSASNHYEHQLNDEYYKYLNNLTNQYAGSSLFNNTISPNSPNSEQLGGPIKLEMPERNSKGKIILMISLLLVTLFILLYEPTRNQQMSELIASSEKIQAKEIEASEIKLDLPTNTRVSVKETAKLDTILEDLIQKEADTKTKSSQDAKDNNDIIGQTSDVHLSKTESNANGDAKGQTVRTDGPVESNELADLVNAYDHNKLSSDDESTNTDAPLTNDTLSRESANNPIVAGYDKIPGADKKQVGRIFKVVRSSDVYKEPSLRSTRLANLKFGQHVEVVEYLGSWLKIRSEKGREGYIFSNCCE